MPEVNNSQENNFTQGVSLYKQKKYLDSLTMFLSAMADSNVNEDDLSYYLGLCYFKLEKYDESIIYLEQIVTSEYPEERLFKMRYLQCRYLLAVCYVNTGRRRLADYELNQLIDANYKKASVYASLAYTAWQSGNADLSIEYYQKAIEIDPNNINALNGLGFVLAEKGEELAKALSYCKKAISMAPNNAACLDSIGWVYFRMGLIKDSLSYLSQAYAKDKNNKIISEHLNQVKMVNQ